MTLVREPGSEILAQFTPPTRGTWINTAIHTIPLDAVYNSLNVYIREGKLRNRPGMTAATPALPTDTTFSKHIIGGAMGVTPTDKYVFAPSRNRLYLFSDTTDVWTAIAHTAGAPMATADTDVVDIAFLETSSTYVALFAHTSRPLIHWKPGDATVAVIPGGVNIPTAKSICISGSRVVALVAPHTVVWSRILNYTNFDALAIAKRAQTTDTGVCVRSLSALSFVLYKEYSIHTARAQAGLDEGSVFAFAEPIIVEGPAGIYAVVEVEGRHIYMTKSGRIGIFDGTNYPTWIADGIWFYLQGAIDQTVSHLIRGVYDYRLNIVVFFYPIAGGGGLRGMVVINLPFPGFEAQAGLQPYAFIGLSSIAITHTCTKRFDAEINRAMLFPQPLVTAAVITPQNFNENATLDDDDTFSCLFQTGLQPMPDARHAQISVETFLERAEGYGTVNVEIVTSHSLENPSGTIHTTEAQTINLTDEPVNEYIGFNKNMRFYGLRYQWQSGNIVRYSGAVVYSSNANRYNK